jgi:D-aminoacyl-tRNA deacylase
MIFIIVIRFLQHWLIVGMPARLVYWQIKLSLAMRTIIQRVLHANVVVDGQVKGQIEKGLLMLVGIEDADTMEDIEWLCNKIVQLRIFDDANGVMNCNVLETGGGLLAVSQFTLHASTKKGNRPSYIKASKPSFAQPMFEQFLRQLEKTSGLPVASGVFGADMKVSLLNDGPVTIFMDTKQKE